MNDQIELTGVETHNLKHLHLNFPLGQVSVVTGVSGSGKSSLVFDTLYAESYRRYVDSLSSFARQFMKSLPKPKIKAAKNLPPAIAVKQTRMKSNNRSTVGSLTEINELIHILFVHLAEIYCPNCHTHVLRFTPRSITQNLFKTFEQEEKVLLAAPLHLWQKANPSTLKDQLIMQGFSRVIHQGVILKLETLESQKIFKSAIIIDRLSVQESQRKRFMTGIDLALKLGKGQMQVIVQEQLDQVLSYSLNLSCRSCQRSFSAPSLALFSFNHPLGACASCQGYGRVFELDWQKIIPDLSQSIASKGIAPLNFGSHSAYYGDIKKSANKRKISLNLAFSKYNEQDWLWLRQGDGGTFGGMKSYFDWLNSQKYKAHYRIHAARFNTYTTCPQCHGHRHTNEAIVYKILQKNIADIQSFSIADLQAWLKLLIDLDGQESSELSLGLKDAFEEIGTRLHYLMKVGLSYLSLDRPSNTLSGGELQRINMARCLGSAMTDTLYCLDEPTCGLHAQDSRNLLEILYELRDQGNTIVVVEHEQSIIQGADHLIEIGPQAGHKGGQLVYQGPPVLLDSAQCSRKKVINRFSQGQKYFELKGANTHNLKNIDVLIPLGKLTVVCGVSGSGKTSLVQHTLYPTVKALGDSGDFSAVHLVDQTGIGRSTRSNIITYLGIFDVIRKMFAKEKKAKELGLSPGSFSFNVPGGRCEHCKGLGTVIEDLSFLGELDVLCPECEGRRFTDEVLSVSCRGVNLIQLMALTVQEGSEIFFDVKAIREGLQGAINLGLGYLTLGQMTSSFSGGEAQRLKLLSLLQETLSAKTTSKPMLLIFDEPSSGLSAKDISTLLGQFDFLTKQGHTLVVVEHQMDMIRQADWLLDIGPQASLEGGRLVYQGPPEGIKKAKESVTARFV